MSPSVFSCRRFAVALLVRCAEVGESRLQRPKANLSRWNLKVTTQAAGPGIWPVEARVSWGRARRQRKGRQTGLRSSNAMGVPWCWLETREGKDRWAANQTRPGPDQSVRGAERGEWEGGRGSRSRSAGCFNKKQFCRQPTRNQREIGSWMAEKVAEGGLRVEGSILGAENRWSLRVSRGGVVGGAGVVRDGGGGSCSLQRNSGCARVAS